MTYANALAIQTETRTLCGAWQICGPVVFRHAAAQGTLPPNLLPFAPSGLKKVKTAAVH